jgi:hypothetical protein
MPHFAFDDFEESELSRIYLAARLAEAKRVEEVLDANGIDYAVEVEPYAVTLLFIGFGEYKGAAFYVRSGQAEFCRRILAEAGLDLGILGKDEAE